MSESNEDIRICTELPPLDFASSLESAVSARSDNVVMPQDSVLLNDALNDIDLASGVIVYRKRWRRGRTLSIAFVGDVDDTVRRKITDHAREWLPYVDLEFDFVSGDDADIRISTMLGKGSYSYIGTDAEKIPASQETMNFGWLHPDTSEEDYRSVVLHEFGHAIGAIHEHKHPEANIPWDRDKVYRYYARTQGWDEDQVDVNIFRKYARKHVNASQYDPHSIMHYHIPNELTIGDFETPWNSDLSDTDKSFFPHMYR